VRVVVVGAGIAGASAAYHAARSGAEVVLVDREAEGRATSAGAGIVCPWSSRVTDPDWYRLSAAGARYYPELVARLAEDGETDLGYRRVGALCLPADADGLAEVRDRVLARRADAPEAGDVSTLTADEARALFPPLAPDTPAVHVAGAARVDGRLIRDAMRRAAARHGARLMTGTARLVADGRVRAVEVDGVRVDADAVIAAAGAWTPQLLSGTGVRVAVDPQRGQIVHLGLPGVDTSTWPVVLPASRHYLLAFDDSRVVVGATRETGSGFDYRVTAGGLAEVLNEALSVAPGLATARHLETRIGFRPMGPGVTPLLGPVPALPGLTVLTGLGAGGLTMGPYAGRLAAQAATGGVPELDLAPYDPVR